MKKKIAKSLSFLLVAGMLLSLTACGGSAVSSGVPAASEKTDAPVTITILGALDAKTMQNGIQSDPVAKYIEKKLGIQMNVIIADTAGDIGSKINAMIATNDLPDICYLPDFTKQLMAAEKAGELLPLDSYLADYGKNLNSIPINKFSNAYFKKNLSVDGKLYGLGTLKGAMDNGLNPGISNYIRWDLYKQLGYPAINTWDDLLPILKKMQDLEPKTKDGSKVYGIGAFFGESGSDALITYMPGYVNGVLSLGSCWSFDAKTNSMSDKDNFNDLNSSWWQSIRFFNKAYQMGILDPDSITQKNTQYMEFAQANEEALREAGTYYQHKVRALAEKYPKVIDNVGGLGYLLSIFFHDPEDVHKFTSSLNYQCIDVSSQTYKKSCPPAALTKPPIIATKKMIDYLVDKMDSALKTI